MGAVRWGQNLQGSILEMKDRRNERRTQRKTARLEIIKAKAVKRKWTVFLLLTLLAIGAALWVAFK